MTAKQRPTILAAAAALPPLLAACSGGGGGGTRSVPPMPAPAVSQSISEKSVGSDAFVDSIGFNAHFGDTSGPYANNDAKVAQLLLDLGVRHVRDGAFPPNTAPGACTIEKGLASQGVRFTFISSIGFTGPDVSSWVACTSPAAEAIEGDNEYDLNHPASDANWQATLRQFQAQLYSNSKSNPTTASLPVIAPSLTTIAAYTSVGSVAGTADFGNVHTGFNGFAPGNTGYGDNGYGSIAYSIGLGKLGVPNAPVLATETGYDTGSATGDVSLEVQAKYTPRLFAEEYRDGIPRSTDYELLDEPNLPSAQFADRGIVDATLAPKPAFYALKNLIAVLAEPGAAVVPSSLSYTLENAPGSVHHLLLQKSSGEYDLLLWQEISSYDSNKLVAANNPAIPVTLVLPYAPATASYLSYDRSYAFDSTPLPSAAALTNLPVTDGISIVRFTNH